MRQLSITVPNPTGLHARPAKVLVKLVKSFKSDIRIQHGEKNVSGKSVISLLTLGVERNSEIVITADGPDEDDALNALQTAIEEGLGDDLSQVPATNGHTHEENAAQVSTSDPTPDDASLIKAVPAASGIAIGPLFQYVQSDITIDEQASNPKDEQQKLSLAIEKAGTELSDVASQVQKRLGEDEAAIFLAHKAILEDQSMLELADSYIADGQSASRAWQQTVDNFATTLASVNDETIAGRATDIRDVGQRVQRLLSNSSTVQLPDHPVVVVSTDLTPSDTISLDPERVLGFCTAHGGASGHTAILARSLGLPAIVGAGENVLGLANGIEVILDGAAGTLQLSPDEATLKKSKESQAKLQAQSSTEMAEAQASAVTTDGHHVEVVANIANLADAQQAINFGAEGVGLLRTEFLFLDRQTAPSEQEQFEMYRDIALALEGKPVIIRTLDIGGDKPLPYLTLPEEENPFLGQRGIRLCLARPELLRTQLRAILRASTYGKLRIMFPMIAKFDEWQQARALVKEIQEALNIPPVEVGIMIEVPSAALLAPVFAQEVDFFSIGTNDLTQYTLAMDRTNPLLFESSDGLDPAVLYLIGHTVRAAHAVGKWVGICGELAADPQAVPILTGLGVDELSVSVPSIPNVKSNVRKLSYAAAKKLAEQSLTCSTAANVRQTVEHIG